MRGINRQYVRVPRWCLLVTNLVECRTGAVNLSTLTEPEVSREGLRLPDDVG